MPHLLADGAATPAPVPDTDETLVCRLRDGDAGAGEALARRYHEPLTRFLAWLAGPRQVDDLFQQTWLSVLGHLGHFDPSSGSGGFKAWLFRIATNKVNDHWRSHGRERNAAEGLSRITEAELPPADYRLGLTEQARQLQLAMGQLSEQHRQILMLRFYGRMKFTDIAQTLGLPLNTALGRVHKALKKLRQLMDAA
jgi:RNA polymerase sigma-70 factor (ECF subfamily)